MKRICVISFILLAAAGCGQSGTNSRLHAGGSSFVFPMMSKWADEYHKAKGLEVNYDSIGSGRGIQLMTDKTFDFGCTDGPLNDDQLSAAKAVGGEVVHIPLVMGAVVPAYNLEELKDKEPLVFSGPVLADIFLGKIKKWNDKAVQELNPDVKLPDKNISVAHRSDGSGTTYIWVDYLSKVSPEWKKKVGTAEKVDWPVGEGADGNQGVSGFVKGAPGSLGYIELTYAMQNNIKHGKVQNKTGNAITANLVTITAAGVNSLSDLPDDLRYSITDADGKDSFPICGTTWAIVYVNQPAGKGKQIADYLRWCTHEGRQYCDALQYATPPQGLLEKIEKKLGQIHE